MERRFIISAMSCNCFAMLVLGVGFMSRSSLSISRMIPIAERGGR